MNNKGLFGDKVISSIGFDEDEIIRDLLYLHSENKKIDLDPTYSIGNFYKSKRVPNPTWRIDINPQVKGVMKGDSGDLNMIDDDKLLTIMFDPPFVMSGKTKPGKISTRFSSFEDFDELKEMYTRSLMEFYRILKKKGIVIFKCQDVVRGRKQYFTHACLLYTSDAADE